MPAYNTVSPPALGIGDTYNLSTASLGGAVLTQQVALHQVPGNPANVTIFNFSAATLTIEVANVDGGVADYLPLLGATCSPNAAISFSTTAPFLAVLPSADPGAFVISIRR
jgi:hypothetical protein